jgi:hypothetical protein
MGRLPGRLMDDSDAWFEDPSGIPIFFLLSTTR